MSEELESNASSAPMTVGAKLRAEREAAGLSRADIAARTKIPERHLAAIEDGKWSEIPGRTYISGFSRSYARALGLDGNTFAALALAEFAAEASDDQRSESQFEPGDPSRVPSSRLAWLAAAGGFVIVIAVFALRPELFFPAASLPSLVPERAAPTAANTVAVAAPSAPAQSAAGPVVFTALKDRIWVKFTDAAGNQLMQKEMTMGESYIVPADANGPTISTARPDALQVTIGGKPVTSLSATQQRIREMPVSAAALLAREVGVAAAVPNQSSPTSQASTVAN
jgi:cytoskeleton protein RodZ